MFARGSQHKPTEDEANVYRPVDLSMLLFNWAHTETLIAGGLIQ